MLATAAQLGVSAMCALYLPPWAVAGVAGFTGWLFGKLLGVPMPDVTQQSLTQLAVRDPDRAVAVTAAAMQSLPPGHADAATIRIVASLHPPAAAAAGPSAADRPTTITFVGATEYPAAVPNAPPSAAAQGGARVDDDGGYDDAVTRPTRPDRAPR
jgi:hypothetical protein